MHEFIRIQGGSTITLVKNKNIKHKKNISTNFVSILSLDDVRIIGSFHTNQYYYLHVFDLFFFDNMYLILLGLKPSHDYMDRPFIYSNNNNNGT